MKLGFSSFSFSRRMGEGDLSIADVIDWIGDSEGEHMEIATVTFSPRDRDETWNLDDDGDLLDTIRTRSASKGVELSGLCLPADFLVETSEERQAQVERVKHHVQIADALGIRFLRHDVTAWARAAKDVGEFEAAFPVFVDVCAEIAEFARPYDITTSVENHGFFMNASERVRRLVHAVDSPNFGTTIDVGNFLCVDEDPRIGTSLNLPIASFVHLKDFYVRRTSPGEGWLETSGGNHLLGSIIGYGDMDVAGIVEAMVAADYDGYVSIEFEGNEDPLFACAVGATNARRLIADAEGARS